MLAGVGMGNMTCSFIAVAMIGGFNFAADTLISQAAGAKEYEFCGVVLNRGRTFILCLFIPMCLVIINAGTILQSVVPKPEVAEYAQEYLNYQIFGLVFLLFSDL